MRSTSQKLVNVLICYKTNLNEKPSIYKHKCTSLLCDKYSI